MYSHSLYFTNACADHLSKTLTSFGSQQPDRVVSMGPGSNLECGNLDLAITYFEFDLLMRVDSNTKGHTTWFYFKVKEDG
jgi:hypothetical protein